MKTAFTCVSWTCLALLTGGAVFAQSLVPPTIVAQAMPQHGERMKPLQSMVSEALERAPAIREAQANWRAAEQDALQSRGALWPRLELNANSRALTPASQTVNAVTGRMGATASYNVYDFGRARSQIDARESTALGARNRFLLASETTTFDTVNAYLQLLKYQRLVGIYEQHIVDLDTLVGKLAEIVSVFAGRRSELTQAQSRLGQARDALATLKAKKREYQLSLVRQTGASTLPIVPDLLPDIPVAESAALLDGARQFHPIVRAARAEAAAARAQAAEAAASLKPQADLQLSKQTGRDANGFTSPAQLYMTFKWVAFDGFGTRANVQAQEDRARAAEERAAQYLMEIDFNIKSALADYEAQSGRVRELALLVARTDQVRRDTFDQWRELGRRSLLDVLTAESEHLNTLSNLASSDVDQVLALARLRHEAGTLKEWLLGGEGSTAPAGALPQDVEQPVQHAMEQQTQTAEAHSPSPQPAYMQVVFRPSAQAPAILPAAVSVQPVAPISDMRAQTAQVLVAPISEASTPAAPSMPMMPPAHATFSQRMSVPPARY